MFKIMCVTSRTLCDDFFLRIAELDKMNIPVILREKDLTETEYEKLAKKTMEHCGNLIIHSHISVAKKLGIKRIHLPFMLMREDLKNDFDVIGVSVHSSEEAVLAEKMGASYVIAGHIFATDCKKGLEPRGLDYLENIVNSVNISVYGIGGITSENADEIKITGADGVCIMSGLMTCKNIEEYLRKFKSF